MKKIFKGIANIISTSIHFVLFCVGVWLTTFAAIIVWHALPSITLLRIAGAVLMYIVYFMLYVGKKKKTQK